MPQSFSADTSATRSSMSLEERLVATVMIAPFFVAFALYVAWVIHNGGDPTEHPALLRANIEGPLLSVKNVLGIFVNGMFHAIIAGLLGVLVGSMYGAWRNFSQPPAPFETTLDELIARLEATRAEIGGDAKVAVSRDGGTWPLDLGRVRKGALPQYAAKESSAPALVLNV